MKGGGVWFIEIELQWEKRSWERQALSIATLHASSIYQFALNKAAQSPVSISCQAGWQQQLVYKGYFSLLGWPTSWHYVYRKIEPNFFSCLHTFKMICVLLPEKFLLVQNNAFIWQSAQKPAQWKLSTNTLQL